MDYISAIEDDGYTYTDLTEDNQLIIRGMRCLQRDFEMKATSHLESYDDESPVEMACREIAEFIYDILYWLELQIARYQVGMIENQTDV